MRFHQTIAALALLTLLAPAAEAGWMIVDDGGNQTSISRGRLKLAPRQAQGVSMVLDVGRGRMWVADGNRRAYWEGTVEEYCQSMRTTMAGAMADMEKQMAETMKDMSPAQREQIQQMMKNARGGGPAGPPPKVTVEKTAETDKIAGLTARKFRVLSNGRLYEEMWMTTDPALLRDLEMSKAPDTFGRMSACMAGMAGGPRPEGSEEFRKLYSEGWPLKVVYYGGGEGGPGPAGVTVMKVEQRDIPERDFTLPAGYRAAPLNEVVGAPGR
jgi:uncharacterized protein DUF4412